ncbi:hypothetical protein [Pseudomonas sp. ZB1P45]|uniref:hypothetical protein n=1 Tax=Pseudomonas frigoris TaxID=3398356 RepID=UPI0039F00E9D
MTAKGVWGLAIAGLMVLGSWVGAPLGDSLVKEGKLPDWISAKLAGLSEFLSQYVQFALWEFILAVVVVGVVVVAIYRGALTTSDQEEYIAHLRTECEEREQRCLQLEDYKVLLMEQLAEKTQALEAMEALEAQKALQAPEAVDVPALGFKVLTIVARCADREARPLLSTIASAIPVGHVEAHAAIDVLIEQNLLEKVPAIRGAYFRFTPEGRAYYLKHRDS